MRKLSAVAMDGLDDMLPALHAVATDGTAGRRLEPVLGPRPLWLSASLGVLALAVGEAFQAYGPEFPFKQSVNWSAVVLGLALALLVRRSLFASTSSAPVPFTELAAALLPGVLVVVLGSALFHGLTPDSAAPPPTGPSVEVSRPLTAAVQLLGTGAGLAIAVASLCYSRAWAKALVDLAVRLAVFKIMIWVTALVLIEIGIVGRIVGALLSGLFSITVPEWLTQLADLVSWVTLMSLAYLAVIGGTWTVCRDTYGELLEKGEVDILARLHQLVSPPKSGADGG